MPIRYVADVAAAARFYSALGLAGGDGSRSGNWLELGSSGGSLGLHIVRESHGDGAREVELSFVAAEPLEKVREPGPAPPAEPGHDEGGGQMAAAFSA